MNEAVPAPGPGPASTHHATRPGGLIPAGTTTPSPASAPPAQHPASPRSQAHRAGRHRRTDHEPEPGRAPRRGLAPSGHEPGPWLEKIGLEGKAGGTRFRLTAEIGAGSQLSITMTAFLLVTATCLMMGATYLFGVSALITSLAASAGAYVLAHLTSRCPGPAGPGEKENPR